MHSIRYKIDNMSLEGLDHVLQIEGTRVTKQKKEDGTRTRGLEQRREILTKIRKAWKVTLNESIKFFEDGEKQMVS